MILFLTLSSFLPNGRADSVFENSPAVVQWTIVRILNKPIPASSMQQAQRMSQNIEWVQDQYEKFFPPTPELIGMPSHED